MSCRDGERCDESRKRLRALVVLGAMLVIFIALSAFSFLGSRDQATPEQFYFGDLTANDGKRVFQAYNCMGCHTLVGNGAYFAPDLTEQYEKTGPAWLAAFLPSAGGWPTEAALKVQLADPAIAADAGTSSLDEYYAKFPGARARVVRREGTTLMPNLPITREEVGKLIAYLEYTSAMNTEGWPPAIQSGSLEHRLELVYDTVPVAAAALTAPAGTNSPVTAAPATVSAAAPDPAGQGEEIAAQYGCTACHSPGTQRLVGPGWGGLYGSRVELADGSTVSADDAYLVESIVHPDAQVVGGYSEGTMPGYSGVLSDSEVAALVAYIRSLENPQ